MGFLLSVAFCSSCTSYDPIFLNFLFIVFLLVHLCILCTSYPLFLILTHCCISSALLPFILQPFAFLKLFSGSYALHCFPFSSSHMKWNYKYVISLPPFFPFFCLPFAFISFLSLLLIMQGEFPLNSVKPGSY